MSLRLGDQEGEILAHGTDTSQDGKPFVWVTVLLDAKDELTARGYLEGGTEEKTKTAIRMTRAMLKLCGFDPDTSELSDLDNVPRLLVGNRVPVNVSKKDGYTNVNIARPRGIPKERLAQLTSALRDAKSKDEPSLPPKSERKSLDASRWGDEPKDDGAAVKKALADQPNFDDIPFAFIIAMLTIVGSAMFA